MLIYILIKKCLTNYFVKSSTQWENGVNRLIKKEIRMLSEHEKMLNFSL